MSNSGLSEIESLIESTIAEHNIIGLAVGLVKDQSTTFIKPYGVSDSATQSPVTTDTLFRLGSITKIFTSYLLMQLVEAGQVQLDDAITTYLPEFKKFDSNSTVMFQHLATHTSGLPMMPPSIDLPQEIEAMQSVSFPNIVGASA
ncbi:MAG: serine hydrolase domain-containing protein [Chloroflexota bacterium]